MMFPKREESPLIKKMVTCHLVKRNNFRNKYQDIRPFFDIPTYRDKLIQTLINK